MCADLLRSEAFDVLFITIFPTYSALLGPVLKRKFKVRFVLDYVDPWVGAWGDTVGPGRDGRPNLKSRITRALAERLEPLAARSADAITAVSGETHEQVRIRYPELTRSLYETIPFGGEQADFEQLRTKPRTNPYFDAADGRVHVCYLGTLLPLGLETLRAVLAAASLLRARQPGLYSRLRLHFFGTSNQTRPDAETRVLPIARELGVDDCISEVAPRIDYLDALAVQTQASAILMMGSSERHYTASKLYPGLLARRPILAVYHEESSVVEILRDAVRPPTARLVTYNDASRAESRTEAIYAGLLLLVENPVYDASAVDWEVVKTFSAEALAGRLAAVFERVRSLR
jgi:hypothetical protein